LLTHPTSARLEALGFTGMAKALDEQRRASDTFENLSFEERLGLLVDREASERDAKRLATRLGLHPSDRPPASKTSICVAHVVSTMPSWLI